MKPAGYRKLKKIASNTRFPSFGQNNRCLDIGASAGGFSLYLLEQGVKSVLAIEISAEFEPYLKEIQSSWSNFSYIITNFFEVDLDKIGKFDTVLADLTVNPYFLLREIDSFIRVIQPGIQSTLLLTFKLGRTSDPETLIEEIESTISTINCLHSHTWFDSLEKKKEKLLLLQFGA
ncbi:MAG: SAM-dependent methyltransferase [Candidatus Hodarchaeales archaeon]